MAASAASAQPTVLFSDTFERTTGNSNPDNGDFLSDWGITDNGLGGFESVSYITTPTRDTGGGINQTVQDGNDPTDGDNEGVIRFGAVTPDFDLSLDPNVLAGGGYTVDFDFNRNTGGTGFISFFLGFDPDTVATTSGGAAFAPINGGPSVGTDHAYILQSNPSLGNFRVQVFEEGVLQDPPGEINIFGPNPQELLSAQVRVEAPDGFDAGDEITVSLIVDGTPIVDATNTAELDGEFGGYFGFSSNLGSALIDNLVVTALGTATGGGIVGDYDDSGQVEQGDLNLVLNNWGTVAPFDPNGDPFTTANVDQEELNRVLNNWGATAAPSFEGSAVPEPATAAVLAGLGLLGLRRRRG
ncbi:MAG: PEP-CTERM sorting domain-containing protein [Planctomycetota bacterium]